MALTQVSRGLLSTSIDDNGNATAITIDSSENVGIGGDPASLLDVSSTGEVVSTVRTTSTSGARQATLRLNVPSTGGDDPAGRVQFTYGTGYTVAGSIEMSHTANNMKFLTGTTEAMRISGDNLLVGKTASDYNTAGIEIDGSNDRLFVTRAGTPVLINRKSTDGALVSFYRDTTPVGSILSSGGDGIIVQGVAAGSGLLFHNSDALLPAQNGNAVDATIDLGRSTPSAFRFKDIYRSGSTYTSSDRNMKQDIRDLTDAERNVAVAAKGLLKAFRFIDTVEAEGDSANIHFGIIAQDLAAAFTAEGLDANDYQVYKSATTTDEDGNEQARLNVCYENLLAFIISAI